MTNKQIESYIWRWQRQLGLQEWEVGYEAIANDIVGERGDADLAAQLTTSRGSMAATMSLAVKRPDDELAGDIRHELLHLTLNDMWDFVIGLMAHLGPQARALAEDMWEDIDERTVLRLDRMIDGLLIEQQKGKANGD